jgi:hypothetical protein
MHKLIRAVPAALAAAAVVPAVAFGSTAAGVGSSVQGHDSAGGKFFFAFDALAHSNSAFDNGTPIVGPYVFNLSDTFNCSGKKGAKPGYAFSTYGGAAKKYPQNIVQPFPAVDHSYQSFHYLFTAKYQNSTQTRTLGTATISVTGQIKQTSGPVGGPGKAIANGTIGIRVSGSCHTGTLKWSATGSIVNPNPNS